MDVSVRDALKRGVEAAALSCCTLDCPTCMCLHSHLHCRFVLFFVFFPH